MVFCAVYGCSHRTVRDKCSFFRIPTVKKSCSEELKSLIQKRRDMWIQRINRKDLTEMKANFSRVCSDHFISGKPSKLRDINNPDWAPSVNLGHDKIKIGRSALSRYNRLVNRAQKVTTSTLIEDQVDNVQEISCNSMADSSSLSASTSNEEAIPVSSQISHFEASTATSMNMLDIEQIVEDNKNQSIEIYALKSKLANTGLNESSLIDDKIVNYYTGLPNRKLFDVVLQYLGKGKHQTPLNALSQFQECLLFFMKLRLNLDFKDIGYRFGISETCAGRIFSKWLHVAHVYFKRLIVWPDRETMMKTMPSSFRCLFGTKVIVIIDCFEIFIDRPSSLDTRASTWSNYKQHNTVKYLVGITPQGTVSFISDGWGGRVSDKQVTLECGLLENLLPGDIVLADRGFNNVLTNVELFCAKLVLPASTKGKVQLSIEDVQQTRNVASLRIHVERVIGHIKKKFKILKGTLPIDFLQKKDDLECPIDRIVNVCCALSNLTPSIVS